MASRSGKADSILLNEVKLGPDLAVLVETAKFSITYPVLRLWLSKNGCLCTWRRFTLRTVLLFSETPLSFVLDLPWHEVFAVSTHSLPAFLFLVSLPFVSTYWIFQWSANVDASILSGTKTRHSRWWVALSASWSIPRLPGADKFETCTQHGLQRHKLPKPSKILSSKSPWRRNKDLRCFGKIWTAASYW